MAQCAFCLQDSQLVNSHIIPKAIYAFGEEKTMLSKVKIVPSDINKYEKKVPSGIYCQFLCRKCEDHFMGFDDYAIRFLQGELKATPRNKPYIILDNISGKRLSLFFISVLWRAHYAKHEVFKNVKLGEVHEVGLREILLRKDLYLDRRYSVLLQRLDTNEPITGFINPYYGKQLGGVAVNHYVVCIPWFRAFIKVDQRKWPDNLHDFELRLDDKAGFFLQELEKSKELKLMRNIVRKRNTKF